MNFTGIDSDTNRPIHPKFDWTPVAHSARECVDRILLALEQSSLHVLQRNEEQNDRS